MMKIYTRCFNSQERWILNTVEPRFNEPLYNELLGLTNDFFISPGKIIVKCMEQNLYITNLDLTNILVVSPKIR